MSAWIGIGLGLVIGLLLGVLVAALVLQARLRSGQAQSLAAEVQRVHAEAEVALQQSQAATAAAQAQTTSLQQELAKEKDEHAKVKKELAALKQEHDIAQRQLATQRSMTKQANTEKEQMLIGMAELRAENDRLRSEAAAVQPAESQGELSESQLPPDYQDTKEPEEERPAGLIV
jgi:hypothetical protein